MNQVKGICHSVDSVERIAVVTGAYLAACRLVGDERRLPIMIGNEPPPEGATFEEEPPAEAPEPPVVDVTYYGPAEAAPLPSPPVPPTQPAEAAGVPLLMTGNQPHPEGAPPGQGPPTNGDGPPTNGKEPPERGTFGATILGTFPLIFSL